MKNLSKAGVGVGAGVAGLALAKSGGALKAVALAFAGLFSHGGAGEVATLVPAVTRSAAEVTAVAPALREAPGELGALSPVGRAVSQALVRVPGQERQQLQSLLGDQRDQFLVLVCREDVKALGLRAYLGGAFRDWVPETVAAFGRLGLRRAASLLEEARTLPAGSPRWTVLEREFLTSGLS